MKAPVFAGLLCVVPLSAAGPLALEKLPPPAARKVDFASEVYPLFRDSCFRCHGAEKQKGKYRMDSRKEAFRDTSEWGPAIKPGDSKGSAVVAMMAGLVDEMLMPPPGGKPGESDPLTREQIGVVRAWIDQGGSWPDGPIEAPVKAVTFKDAVFPILKTSCGECHSGASSAGGFRIDTFGDVVKGGATYGRSIKPGDPSGSPLITIVSGRDEDIPQPQKHRLPDKVVLTLREWIQTGAKE